MRLLLTILLLAGPTWGCHLHRAIYPIVRVIDGDTVAFDASTFLPPPLNTTLHLRIRGVDCPESGRRARCPAEADLAAHAVRFTEESIDAHAPANTGLLLCAWDKYGGRVLGDVAFWNGPSGAPIYLSERLTATGHAVEYTGRGVRHDWCAPACSALTTDGQLQSSP